MDLFSVRQEYDSGLHGIRRKKEKDGDFE